MTALADLAGPEHRDALAKLLAAYLPEQRWFGGKARTVAAVDVGDTLLLRSEHAEVLDVLADVSFADGHNERYQVPLVADEPAPHEAVVGEVAGLRLVDATFVPGAARVFAEEACDGEIETDDPRRMTAEQSNTSIVLADRWMLKIFRKLEEGENPDVEITRALTAAGFPNAPAQRGALVWRDEQDRSVDLAVVSAFVAGAREGWAVATEEVDRLAAAEAGCDMADPWLLDRVGELGSAVARMHIALGETLGTRAAEPEDLADWAAQMRRQTQRVFATAEARAPQACAPILRRHHEILDRFERLELQTAAGPLMRIHGDLHLGQVLLDPDGEWQILDFEGEPARPLAERRQLGPPVRDVAGMLRSFDYAAARASPGDLDHVPASAQAWRDEARRRFTDGYRAAAAGTDVLPDKGDAVAAQLDAFELDKAVYEVGYELANRPDWVAIPVGGILRVLDR